MRAFKILVMESISIHGSRSIQVKKNPKEMHVANIRTFYVTARVRLHLYVESFVFSVANSPPLHTFSLTAFTVTVALVRKARNEFGRNFWHSFKSTNYHCITNI